ncbi:MAG TPA: DNA polymerase III subunit beta [Terriglobia bacterium]|nr:DNA polymerase III subunit beta [Terriglobia bacterium]
MEFSVKRSDILKELELADSVVEKKQTIPVLSNVLVEAEGAAVRLSATDLDLAVRSSCPAKIKKEGASTVPGRRLLEIIRSLPEAEIKIKLLENHWIQVTCERSSFKMVGMAKDNFPSLPEASKKIAAFPAQALATLIARTGFAISNEESRYTLNGALMLLKPEKVMMVATDGHRLAHIEREVQVEGLSNELRVLVPKKAMEKLPRLLSQAAEDANVEFTKDENHLFFSLGERMLISRILTGQFPNYEAVLPRGNERMVVLEKGLIADAIRRASLLADERSRAIRIQVDKGKLEIFSSSGDLGEAHEVVDAEYDGEAMEIGFNYQYLLDFLNVVGEVSKVRLELKDEQSAGQLRPLDDGVYQYRYVVMPMRV